MQVPKNLSYAFGIWLLNGGYQRSFKNIHHFIAYKGDKVVRIDGKTLKMNEHAQARYKVFLKCWLDSQCDYPKKLVQEFKC